MTTAGISFEISPSDSACPLGVEVWVDQQQIFNCDHLTATETVQFDVEDDDGEHELRVVLKNKLPQHTKIDTEGNIVEDSVITVDCFEFDEIGVDQVVQEQAVYHHNFNGSAADVQDKFFGSMGCNGSLSLRFSTPIYIWLLEHM
jgi:hypothetical protein